MPIFQKKPTVTSDGATSPQKASPKPQAQGTTGTGGRRSLTMVGKALAEVVNSRKPNPSPKASGRSLAKVKEFDAPSDRTYDSSTAVESSSTAVSLPAKATGNNRTTVDTKSTPKLASGSAVSKFASGSPTLRGSPKMKSRKLPGPDSSPTSSLSLGRSSSALTRRPGHAASPSVSSIATTTAPTTTPTAELPSVTKVPSIKNRGPTVSPTLGRKSRHSPSMSTSSIPNSIAIVNVSPIPESASSQTETSQLPARGNSIRSKLPSALPQPRSRPKSGIFTSAAPTTGIVRPKAATTAPSKRVLKEDANDTSAKGEVKQDNLKDLSSAAHHDANDVVDQDGRSDRERDSSPTPSIRQLVNRPFSPLPKRLRNAMAKVTSAPLTSLNEGENVFISAEPSRSSATAPAPSTRPLSIIGGRGTGFPRPGTAGSSRARGQSLSGNETKSFSIKGAASQPQAEDLSSPPDARAKRRKSDETPSSLAGPSTRGRGGLMLPSSSRLSVPSISRSRPSHPPHTHLQLPMTPSTSKPSAKTDHTFSIPRNRMISFTFADMAMPDIPDDDDTSFSFDMTHFNGEEEDAHSSKSLMSPLPTIFLPPTQQFTSTPSRIATRGKKKRPSLRPPNATGNDRQSILSWDTIVERSREYQDEAEVSGMLSDVRAPFTPDVRSPNMPAMSASVSEASFNLNVTDADSMSRSLSPLDVSFDGSLVAPNSIAQMLFPSPATTSESASPTTSPNALPDPLTTSHSPTSKTRALESEVQELRLRLAARDSAAEVQASRVTTLESELATIHSVTRDRDLKHRASIYRLACEAASKCIQGVKKEWDLVATVAHGEMDAIAGDRFALQAMSETLAALETVF